MMAFTTRLFARPELTRCLAAGLTLLALDPVQLLTPVLEGR